MDLLDLILTVVAAVSIFSVLDPGTASIAFLGWLGIYFLGCRPRCMKGTKNDG